MYNLLIALGIGALGFLIGALGGSWYYGLFPSSLAFGISYFLLARRTGKQLEQISTEIQISFQSLQGEMERIASSQPSSMKQAQKLQRQIQQLQDDAVAAALEKLKGARELGKWQFLIDRQIRSQMGALEYARRDFDAARPHLEASWARNWQAMGMLACLDMRDQKYDEALKRFDKAKLLGKREPMMWALYLRVLTAAGRTDDAMQALAEALEILPDNEPLKKLRDAIANDRMKKFKWDRTFGQVWYQFFPEEAVNAPPSMRPGAQRGGRGGPYQRGGRTFPHPRR